jgi:hypothetical protein
MAEPHVVTALRAKRAEISGHVHDLERKLARHRASLAAIDTTIRLYAPELNPDSIPPKRTYRRTRYFAKGELSRRVVELHRMTPWVWLWCERCQHHAPLACAIAVILWGPDASSDKLRASARCTRCGGKGATLQHPGWAGNHIGFYPFPTGINDSTPSGSAR